MCEGLSLLDGNGADLLEADRVGSLVGAGTDRLDTGAETDLLEGE